MSDKSWRFPPVSGPANIAVIADTQILRRSWLMNHLNKCGFELDRLIGKTDAWVHVGDIIHWRENAEADLTSQEGKAMAWMQARKDANPDKPNVIVPGNHDLASFIAPFPSRTGQQWATKWAQNLNTVKDLPEHDLRIIGVGPDQWLCTEEDGYGPQQLPSSTVQWMADRVQETSMKVLIVNHTPPPGHINGHLVDNGITDLLSSHRNIVAWVSGHIHPNVQTDTRIAQMVTYGENRVACICAPSLGGSGERWDADWTASVISIYPDRRVEVRFRDPLRSVWRSWISSPYAELNP